MSDNEFASSPLITPERLKLDYRDALSVAPAWAGSPSFTEQDFDSNEEGLAGDVLTIAVGTSKARPGKPPTKTAWMLGVCSGAILFELTRHGNSGATNGNGGPNEKSHFRITFAGNAEDNQTVQRLVTGAGLRAKCVMNADNRRDLRAEGLSLTGGGKAIKEAREVAVAHATENARKAGADVEAYERNLWALFILHDELHLDPYGASLSY
ncbi:hypothetical protein [Methylobacterium terrae]|uniref:hypothetical protein n=1 Tax=Methylobacterium terrae TaxID=2202827 RepID=UPI0013A531FE|nr:hypothetical protein [Methylobacterium terrae]